MKKILFQSDDYGISPAVSEGIIQGIEKGIIKNTGLFVNMDYSEEAAQRIKDIDVCLGLDINLVAGKPISQPEEVPSLIDEHGKFLTSKYILENNKALGVEGITTIFEEDPYPFEEVLIETENQMKKFIELTGKLPEYINSHSLSTENTNKALEVIAKKYDVYRTLDMLNNPKFVPLPGFLVMSKYITLEDQIDVDVEELLIKTAIPALKDEETGYYIFHCGFVDYELFKHSSMTLRRIKDLEATLSQNVIKFLEKNEVELITYREIKDL